MGVRDNTLDCYGLHYDEVSVLWNRFHLNPIFTGRSRVDWLTLTLTSRKCHLVGLEATPFHLGHRFLGIALQLLVLRLASLELSYSRRILSLVVDAEQHVGLATISFLAPNEC